MPLLALGMSMVQGRGMARRGSQRIPPSLGSGFGHLRTDIPSEAIPPPLNPRLGGGAAAGNPAAHTTSEPVSFSFRCPHAAVTQHELGDDKCHWEHKGPLQRLRVLLLG